MTGSLHRNGGLLTVLLLSATYALAGASLTPEGTILRIQELIKSGALAEASSAVDIALKSDAHNGGLYNLRGIIHADRKEIKEAEEDFARAIRFSPDLESAYLNLTKACEILRAENIGNDPGILDIAISAYRKFLSRKPSSEPARIQIGKLLFEKGAFAESLESLHALSNSSRTCGLCLLLWAADLAGLGRTSEIGQTAHQFDQIHELDEEFVATVFPVLTRSNASGFAVQLLEALDRRSPLSIDNLERLAGAYERTNRLGEARATLERKATLDPNNPDVLLELARLARGQNDLTGALGYLAHARDLKPNAAPISYFFGVVCIELNLPVEAKKALDKALEIDPANVWYNYARGSVELQGPSAWLAIPFFQRSIAADPTDPRYRFALGVAEFSSQDYESAQREMDAIVSRKETAGGAEYFLGRISKVEGKWSDAAGHFQKSIAAEPNYADSHAELGFARVHLNDLPAAKTEIDVALRLNPLSYAANFSLLAFYERAKDPLASSQRQKLHELDALRAERQELMVRTIKVLP